MMHAATASVDITPPVGIHLSNWALTPDAIATGVHRPLLGKLLALKVAGRRALLVALDLGWWMNADEEWALRASLLRAANLVSEALIVCLTHTHAGPSLSTSDRDRPGGRLIAAYLAALSRDLCAAAAKLWQHLEPVTVTWRTGTCGLAVNRDLRLPDGRWVVGQNPAAAADDTLVLAEFRRADGSALALVCNYAVHPTTLGAGNTLLSPDLVGRAREIVEEVVGGSFVFLQGASGDLSPRVQYSSDVADADRNGDALGYAVLSTLSAMPRSGGTLKFVGVVESGAPLGEFRSVPPTSVKRLECQRATVTLDTQRNDPEGVDSAGMAAHVVAARQTRARRVSDNVTERETVFEVTLWRIGDAILVAHPGEAYSYLAQTLRARYPGRPIVVVNLANGAHQGYLAPHLAYQDGRYPAWQSPLSAGSLERLTEHCLRLLDDIPDSDPPLSEPPTEKEVPK